MSPPLLAPLTAVTPVPSFAVRETIHPRVVTELRCEKQKTTARHHRHHRHHLPGHGRRRYHRRRDSHARHRSGPPRRARRVGRRPTTQSAPTPLMVGPRLGRQEAPRCIGAPAALVGTPRPGRHLLDPVPRRGTSEQRPAATRWFRGRFEAPTGMRWARLALTTNHGLTAYVNGTRATHTEADRATDNRRRPVLANRASARSSFSRARAARRRRRKAASTRSAGPSLHAVYTAASGTHHFSTDD